ncbi:MAG: oxidoreductase [Chloroflexota bacterium]|nr:oxidoreductase [Chloroflexota bacterium]
MTLVAPLAIFWIAALALALADGRQRSVGVLGLAALLAGLVAMVRLTLEVVALGPIVMVAGNWPAGVGISLRADALGVAFALTAIAVLLVAYGFELAGGIESRSFPALTLFLAAGLTGVFITGDAFNFYVFFEIAMVASYVLTAYGEERRQLRAAVIFAVVNLLGSVIFLIGIVSLYHTTGSLDMVSIAARMPIVEENPAVVTGTLLLVALGVKLGIFPFHFWLPAVYTGVHSSVAAMLSGALAIIGAYGLLRIGAGMLPRELDLSAPVLIALGVASILYGGLLSISRHDPAAVVAYSAIGQVGYILIAVAIGGAVGYGAAILFTIWNSMNKTLLFLSGGQLNRYAGIAYAVGGLSVAGIPPVGGFWGKTAVLRATLIADGQITRAFLAAIVVIGGGLSLLYMFQSYGRTYWAVPGGPRDGSARARTGIVVLLAVLIVVLGVWPEPLLALSDQAALIFEAPTP